MPIWWACTLDAMPKEKRTTFLRHQHHRVLLLRPQRLRSDSTPIHTCSFSLILTSPQAGSINLELQITTFPDHLLALLQREANIYSVSLPMRYYPTGMNDKKTTTSANRELVEQTSEFDCLPSHIASTKECVRRQQSSVWYEFGPRYGRRSHGHRWREYSANDPKDCRTSIVMWSVSTSHVTVALAVMPTRTRSNQSNATNQTIAKQQGVVGNAIKQLWRSGES